MTSIMHNYAYVTTKNIEIVIVKIDLGKKVRTANLYEIYPETWIVTK